MYPIEVIGDDEFCLGFSLAGINNTTNLKGEELAKYINEMVKEKQKKIVIIQNKYYQDLPDRVKLKTLTSIQPLFIVLGEEESGDIKMMVKRVFGVDLLNL